MRDRIRIWWKRLISRTWQWGHPDEWSEDEWLDYYRRRR